MKRADIEALTEFGALVAEHGERKNGHSMGTYAGDFVKLARILSSLDEAACNRELSEREQKKERTLTQAAEAIAKDAGFVGIIRNHDPRGGSLLLVCRDGFTNDWGQRGLFVPCDR